MYKEWFGLQRRPFDKTPDPAALYLSPMHEEALARLEQALEDREAVAIAGAIGGGKTTLIRALLDRLGPDVEPVVIVNPLMSPLQLMRQIARGLGIEVPSRQLDELVNQISDVLYSLYEEGRVPYVIIDEAHLLRVPDGFEQLRLLTNYQLDDCNLLALALIGQPELKPLLAREDLRAIHQRIGYFYFLSALDESACQAYVKHRLRFAGGDSHLCNNDIWEDLFQLSEGMPRRINQVMHNALLSAFSRESGVVNVCDIEAAAKELWI